MQVAERRSTAAGPPMVRQANLRTVLEALLDVTSLTATDIIARTGLSRASVHAVCEELISRRLVRELDPTPPSAGAGIGRPSRTYAFHAQAGHVLAIDLGPRTVRALLCDLRGDTVAGSTRAGPEGRPAAAVVDDAILLVDGILAGAGLSPGDILSLAVGVPAPVSSTGRILGPNVAIPGLETTDLVRAFGERYPCAVLVENDANLAILGERWLGVAQGCDHAVMILAGERLGSGIVEFGRLTRGYDGSAGEMDFLELVDGVGDTRGVASIARELGDLAVADFASRAVPRSDAPGALLAQLAAGAEHVTSEHVLQAALGGDAAATAIVEVVAERMARTVAVLSTLLNPEVVVLGGAVAEAGDALLGPIRRRLPEFTRSPTRLSASQLGDRVVATGAARLALDHAFAHLLV